ncbi:b107 [miniopterid betaherpesvirus 1]|uniref:B107 n=1 Tax=miniopterid betaherpesvirus 1 TaxID=3070189 RepID=I3VQA1_9BETA|nr:b107 [miniopterid betaherpesvirus 1]AFK83945.1 b107 [miniopterid betaherpesvirus 1]
MCGNPPASTVTHRHVPWQRSRYFPTLHQFRRNDTVERNWPVARTFQMTTARGSPRSHKVTLYGIISDPCVEIPERQPGVKVLSHISMNSPISTSDAPVLSKQYA